MRKVILPILAVALVLLGISFYLSPVEGSTTTTITTTNTTYTNTTWTNTSLLLQVQQLNRTIQNLVPFVVNQTHTGINQTHTVTTQTTSVQTSTTKVTAQQWYVQYALGVVMVILLTLLGILYKRHSKK